MSLHTALDPLRYPIGRPELQPGARPRRDCIAEISRLPAHMTQAVEALDETQLDTPYRPGGWTLRQVVHHVADSHVNAYIRLRLALTEDWPTIKPYQEPRWAELADASHAPVGISLHLLAPLHARWVALLESLSDADWLRGYVHPENGRTTFEAMTRLYDWHGRHHGAHITRLRERMGW